MARKKLINLNSVELNADGNGPKLPTSDQINYGEIAINYLKDNETIAIKNSNDEIVTFATDESLSNYATKTDVTNAVSGKADKSHTHTKSDITDFPTIPTKTSQLTNDSGYVTKTDVTTALSGYAKTSQVGVTSVSQGSSNGTISVTTNGSTSDVSVKGLNNFAYTNYEVVDSLPGSPTEDKFYFIKE